ncbi:MAG: VOC family protein [Thermoleophilia bacterium]
MVPARITAVTIGARDVATLRDFYARLGWEVAVDLPEFVALRTHGAVLTLYDREALSRDTGLPPAAQDGLPGVVIALNVETPAEVDETVASVRAAGGRVAREPVDTPFGGRDAYVADPEGNLWEVVWVPAGNEMHAVLLEAAGRAADAAS